jgi:outer membrane protein TolC
MTSPRFPIARTITVLGCGLAILTGGCGVDQKKEVATYRKVIDPSAPAPAYQNGQPLTLIDALQLANANSEQLASKGEDYLQALIDKDRAAAAFWPSISLAPSYYSQDKSNKSDSRATQFDVPASGSWNLFNGFRDVAKHRRASAAILQQRDLLLDLQTAVLLDVARVYYQVLRSEQSVRVLQSSLSVQEERLRDTTGRQKAGLARPLDVAQSQAQASQTKVQLLQAQADVINGRNMLAFLINAPIASTPLPDGFDPVIDIPALSAILQEAATRRYDLAAAQAGIKAARQDVASTFNRYYPSVDLNANYFFSRDSSPSDSNWNALFSLNLPIFTAGLIHADVRTAWSRYRQAVLFHSQLQRQIDRDVRTALETLTSTLAQLDELHIQVASAREALRQADESYRVGLATNLERLTAQDQALSAELQLTSAEYDRKYAYLNLLRQTGHLQLPAEGSLKIFSPPTTATTRSNGQ